MQRQERWPDSGNHAFNSIGPIHVLDRVPENSKDRARYDGDIGPPETPGCAGKDRKRRVMDDADCTVESDYERDSEEGQGYDADGLSPCEAWTLSVPIQE